MGYNYSHGASFKYPGPPSNVDTIQSYLKGLVSGSMLVFRSVGSNSGDDRIPAWPHIQKSQEQR